MSTEILESDAKRDIGAEVLEAIREIKAVGGRRFIVQVSQAAEAWLKLGAPQTEFATLLGGFRAHAAGLVAGPSATERRAKALLKVATLSSKAVRKALQAA